ncbi:MAG: hypothetical protein GKR93_06995 [Gammaproteobacteria bacterium]|nr:hypothetical protein [Gammaproteobacteria bacterium]
MFLLLRRLKISLLKEGKIFKYGLYAAGEILLVVVGILIALQVDNWNKENSNRKLEQQYYLNMKAQLLADKKTLGQEIQYNNGFLEQFRQAISIIAENDREQIQKLAKIVLELKNFSDFRRKSSIYQTLVNSGEIKHVRNRSVIEMFQSLEGDYTYIERLEDIHRQAVLDFVLEQVVDSVQIQTLIVRKPDQLYSYQMQNSLVLIIGLIEEKSAIYHKAVADIDETVKLILKGLEITEAN